MQLFSALKKLPLNLLCLFSSFLVAEEHPPHFPMKVEADRFWYEDNKIRLLGDACISSDFASIQAHRMQLTSPNTSSLFPSFRAKDHVRFDLHSGAELFCDEAIFDGEALKGVCLSNSQSGRVIYRDPKISSLPFQAACKKATLYCLKSPSGNVTIDYINAWKDVTIFYDREFSAVSDKAVIHNTDSSTGELVLFKVPHESDTCLLKRTNGDTLEGTVIRLAPELLICSYPSGKFFFPSSTTPFHLRGEKLTWKRSLESISCEGPSELWHRDLGRLSSSEEIVIVKPPLQDYSGGVETISSKGYSEYIYPELADGMAGKLSCHKEIILDQAKKTIVLKSPSFDKPITYEDPLRKIQSDFAILDFDYEANQFTPRNLFLSGHVYVELSDEMHAMEPRHMRKYAISDQLDFNLETGSMLLSSISEQPVLFIDEEKQLTMSAPSVHITVSPEDKEISRAQGLGKVHFTLNEQEKTLIQQYR